MVPSDPGASDGPLYHYCIIRADLPRGVQIAQTIHAAGESCSAGNLPDSTTHAVALETPDEATLLDLEARLVQAGITHVAIREPDAPWNNQLMAIGIPPQVRSKTLRKHLSRYALVR